LTIDFALPGIDAASFNAGMQSEFKVAVADAMGVHRDWVTLQLIIREETVDPTNPGARRLVWRRLEWLLEIIYHLTIRATVVVEQALVSDAQALLQSAGFEQDLGAALVERGIIADASNLRVDTESLQVGEVTTGGNPAAADVVDAAGGEGMGVIIGAAVAMIGLVVAVVMMYRKRMTRRVVTTKKTIGVEAATKLPQNKEGLWQEGDEPEWGGKDWRELRALRAKKMKKTANKAKKMKSKKLKAGVVYVQDIDEDEAREKREMLQRALQRDLDEAARAANAPAETSDLSFKDGKEPESESDDDEKMMAKKLVRPPRRPDVGPPVAPTSPPPKQPAGPRPPGSSPAHTEEEEEQEEGSGLWVRPPGLPRSVAPPGLPPGVSPTASKQATEQPDPFDPTRERAAEQARNQAKQLAMSAMMEVAVGVGVMRPPMGVPPAYATARPPGHSMRIDNEGDYNGGRRRRPEGAPPQAIVDEDGSVSFEYGYDMTGCRPPEGMPPEKARSPAPGNGVMDADTSDMMNTADEILNFASDDQRRAQRQAQAKLQAQERQERHRKQKQKQLENKQAKYYENEDLSFGPNDGDGDGGGGELAADSVAKQTYLRQHLRAPPKMAPPRSTPRPLPAGMSAISPPPSQRSPSHQSPLSNRGPASHRSPISHRSPPSGKPSAKVVAEAMRAIKAAKEGSQAIVSQSSDPSLPFYVDLSAAPQPPVGPNADMSEAGMAWWEKQSGQISAARMDMGEYSEDEATGHGEKKLAGKKEADVWSAYGSSDEDGESGAVEEGRGGARGAQRAQRPVIDTTTAGVEQRRAAAAAAAAALVATLTSDDSDDDTAADSAPSSALADDYEPPNFMDEYTKRLKKLEEYKHPDAVVNGRARAHKRTKVKFENKRGGQRSTIELEYEEGDLYGGGSSSASGSANGGSSSLDYASGYEAGADTDVLDTDAREDEYDSDEDDRLSTFASSRIGDDEFVDFTARSTGRSGPGSYR
jgi:hypothetical protein